MVYYFCAVGAGRVPGVGDVPRLAGLHGPPLVHVTWPRRHRPAGALISFVARLPLLAVHSPRAPSFVLIFGSSCSARVIFFRYEPSACLFFSPTSFARLFSSPAPGLHYSFPFRLFSSCFSALINTAFGFFLYMDFLLFIRLELPHFFCVGR